MSSSVPVLFHLKIRDVFQTVFFVSHREHCILLGPVFQRKTFGMADARFFRPDALPVIQPKIVKTIKDCKVNTILNIRPYKPTIRRVHYYRQCIEPHLWRRTQCSCDMWLHRVKELEASAPVIDNKPADVVPVAAPDDTPLRKQSSDLASLRTHNVSEERTLCNRKPMAVLYVGVGVLQHPKISA